ncbi:MAG: fatty acid desaturase [Myxococcales bacterium]|nr:fatty acid desaturase [Myxococcales bacterium]
MRDAVHGSKPFAEGRNGVAAWQLVTTFLFFAIVMGCASLAPLWLAPFFAFPLGLTLIRIFIFQHDCGHRSFLGPVGSVSRARSNDRLGVLISCVTGIPYVAWRTEHNWHHAHQGKIWYRGVDKTNSPMTVEEALRDRDGAILRARTVRPFRIFVLGFVSLVVLRKRPRAYFQFQERFPDPNVHGDVMRRSCMTTGIGHVAFLAAVGAVAGWQVLLLSMLPSYFVAGGLGTWLFWIQHNFERTCQLNEVEWDHARISIEGSSYLRLGPVLQWFTGNIGLHHVHHTNPRIPNYRLEEARRALAPLACVEPLSGADLRRCFSHVFWDSKRQKMVPLGEVGIIPER